MDSNSHPSDLKSDFNHNTTSWDFDARRLRLDPFDRGGLAFGKRASKRMTLSVTNGQALVVRYLLNFQRHSLTGRTQCLLPTGSLRVYHDWLALENNVLPESTSGFLLLVSMVSMAENRCSKVSWITSSEVILSKHPLGTSRTLLQN